MRLGSKYKEFRTVLDSSLTCVCYPCCFGCNHYLHFPGKNKTNKKNTLRFREFAQLVRDAAKIKPLDGDF